MHHYIAVFNTYFNRYVIALIHNPTIQSDYRNGNGGVYVQSIIASYWVRCFTPTHGAEKAYAYEIWSWQQWQFRLAALKKRSVRLQGDQHLDGRDTLYRSVTTNTDLYRHRIRNMHICYSVCLFMYRRHKRRRQKLRLTETPHREWVIWVMTDVPSLCSRLREKLKHSGSRRALLSQVFPHLSFVKTNLRKIYSDINFYFH